MRELPEHHGSFMNEQFADKLHDLKIAYLQRLPQQVNELIEDYNLLGIHWEPRLLSALLIKLHTLKGSSGTFGLKDFYTSVCDMEHELKQFKSSLENTSPNKVIQANPANQFRGAMEKIIHALHQSQIDFAANQPVQLQQQSLLDKPIVKSHSNPLVYLVDDDFAQGQILKANLFEFGFDVEYFSTLALLNQAVAGKKPDICLIDLHHPQNSEDDVFEVIAAFQIERIPVIVLSHEGNFAQRLKAVRAKAKAFFPKPVKMNDLVAKLRDLLDFEPAKPFRILMIDDQESILNYHKELFNSHGIEAKLTQNPQEIFDLLRDFEPDLFILDYHLPDFNGAEIATLLRQIPTYEATPIVFLTGESAESLKSDLVGIGSDDVISKDLGADKFVSQVISRIKRGKKLRMLMRQDSLTQLLNHGYIQSLAKQMFAQARRTEKPCSFIMIDLDHFKMVNDKFGHGCGDRVIVALTQLLQQRLRQSDAIGRYGGEEFLVLMPDTDIQVAQTIITKLLHQFSQLKFFERNIEFTASFSAGISCSQDWTSSQECIERADQALYQAKKFGRSRVEVFSPVAIDNSEKE